MAPSEKESTQTYVEASAPTVTGKTHQWDPNLAQEKVDELAEAIEGDPEAIRRAQADFTENSPYEEVRAAVRNTDGGEPANTFRMWVLGMLFVTITSALNMFLSMRNPPINFPGIVTVLLVYPCGLIWARYVPAKQFNTFGVRWSLNPGPFNVKEHATITLMASMNQSYAYSTDALIALIGEPFYNLKMSWGFQLLFTLSSNLIGMALAGLFRSVLIWPAALIWPSQFSNTALLYALHDKSTGAGTANGWKVSQARYFVYVLTGMFLYYWFPAVIWQGLSVFAFITWIKPNNVVLNQLFGGFTGLSLIPITFDWTYVSAYLMDPLLTPAHVHFNTLIGLVVFVVITTIGIAFKGSLYSDYLPINTSSTFDNTQNVYNVSRILGPGFTFDAAKYKEYSPMFLAPTLAINYGLSFAALTAVIIHTILFHGREIVYRMKTSRNQEPDIHLKLILKYAPCPDWWYAILAFLSVMLGLATVLAYDSQLVWWAYFVSVILALIFVVPCSMLYGIANIPLALNVISPFLAGFMIPGKPIGVMIFKVFSTSTLGQALQFSSDLKLAHYMKVPPRTTFSAQVVSAIWVSFVQIAVMNWTLGNVKDCCARLQPDHFTCPNGRAFFSSSIVWGVLGPGRLFGVGAMYSSIQWYWLVGAILPVLFYVLARFRPRSKARYLNAPVMLGAMAWLPPATPLSFFSWVTFGLIFNYWIMRRWLGWWHKYNYITAAGLDAGLVISTIVIFFAIQYKQTPGPQWWGNVKPFETLDYLNTAIRKTVGDGEIFGPKVW